MSNVTAVELLPGWPKVALEHARAAIGRLDALGGSVGASHLYNNAMIALLVLNRVDEAKAAHARRICFSCRKVTNIGYSRLSRCLRRCRGDLAAAARIIGHDDAVHSRTGAAARPNVAQLRARLDPLLTAALPVHELARLRAEGAAMRDEQVFKLAFGDEA